MECHFYRLPPELLPEIISTLRLRDLNAFSRCSKRLYSNFNNVLYSRDATRLDRWALQWAAINGVASTASKSIEAGSPIEQYCDMRLAAQHTGDISVIDQLAGPAATPLQVAIRFNHNVIVDLLQRHGAKLSRRTAPHWYGLDQAIANGREDWMRLYLPEMERDGAPHSLTTEKLMESAMKYGMYWFVHYLYGFVGHREPALQRSFQLDAIEVAVYSNSIQGMREILDMKCTEPWKTWILLFVWNTISKKCVSGNGAEFFNCVEERCPMEELGMRNEVGFSDNIHFALVNACKSGDLGLAEIMVRLGARTRYSSDEEWALIAAMDTGNRDIVELLLDHGAELDLNRKIEVPLTGGWNGEYDETDFDDEIIWAYGLKGKKNSDVLHYAYLQKSVEIIDLLVHRGAKITAAAKDESIFLRLAIEGCHPSLIRHWISQGHKVPSDAIGSLFHGRAMRMDELEPALLDAVQLLLQHGALADVATRRGATPLVLLVWHLDGMREMARKAAQQEIALEIGKLLISHGADSRAVFLREDSSAGVWLLSKAFLELLLNQPCTLEVPVDVLLRHPYNICCNVNEAWIFTLLGWITTNNKWNNYAEEISDFVRVVCQDWHNKTKGSKCRVLAKLLPPNQMDVG